MERFITEKCPVVGMSLFITLMSLIFSNSISAQPSTLQAPRGESERQLIREQERQQERLDQQPKVDVRLEGSGFKHADQAIPDNESPCFMIDDIQLEGDVAESFQWLLEEGIDPVNGPPYTSDNDQLLDTTTTSVVGRCLGAVGINIIMGRLQNRLVEEGYVTSRIVTGNQDLRSGVLLLTLVPGRIGEIRFSENYPEHTQRNILPMQAGDLLNLRDIEQALESIKRLPSVETDIQIVPSQAPDAKPGYSDLVIEWSQQRPVRLVATLDNSGSDNTGIYQGGLALAVDNPLGFHDMLNVSVNNNIGPAKHLQGGTEAYGFSYSFPYGYWNFSLNVNRNQYLQTVQGPFENYEYSGDSRSTTLGIARLLHRDSVRKIDTEVRYWLRSSKNYINDAELLPQQRRTGGFEVDVGYRQFVGKSTIDGTVTYRRGTGIFNALPAPEEAFGEGTARPSIVKANLQFSTPFSLFDVPLSYSGVWRRQHNRDRLTAQDRFSIGGRYSVRGFDGENTLLAERGWTIKNDVSMRLGQSRHSLYMGIDYGKVAGFSEQFLLGDHLVGGGIGVNGSLFGASYDAFVGQPINQPDGFTADSTVLYLTLSRVF